MSTTVPAGSRGRGVSLAKGPAGLIGLAALLYGISALIFRAHGFALHFPDGDVHGRTWLRLELNGYSSLLFIAAGLLLMLGASSHWGAKSASFLVALGLGAAAVIAAVRGVGIFGIFAADRATEIVWAAVAAVLFALSLLPRVGGGRRVAPGTQGTPGSETADRGRQPRRDPHSDGPAEASTTALEQDPERPDHQTRNPMKEGADDRDDQPV